jgi:hypothetical protein
MNGDRLARLTARNGSTGREKGTQEAPPPGAPADWSQDDEVPDLDQTIPGDPALFLAEAAADRSPAHIPAEQALEDVRLENAELRQTLGELQRILEDARLREENWTRQEKEYESLLEEKSEVIRELHRKIKEMPEASDRPAGTTGAVPREEELLALHEELERERRQLQEDEESLMRQMRDMELQMSRERAELARQRTDLQRLHTEIQHELELAARDATLRERLAPLQRRAQDVVHRRGAAPAAEQAQAPAVQLAPAPAPAAPTRDSNSILRRLFGK